MRLLEYIPAILLTFLPSRYRKDLLLRNEAIVGGGAQLLLSLGALVGRFYVFFQRLAGLEGTPPDSLVALPEVSFNMGSGVFMAADFFFNPMNALLLYLAFESMFRLLAAVSGQVIGTLPLYVVSAIHNGIDRARHKIMLGPLTIDEVERGREKQKYDLKVRSCRPKLHWNPYMTVEFEGEFYQLINEEPGEKPRRFVYYLRKNPVGRIVVTVDRYKLDDVLKPPTPQESGLKQVLEQARSTIHQAPLVTDAIIRGGATSGFDLKVYSCRQKPDWNSYVSIEFEDQLYELFKTADGPTDRPFIYFLRKNPVGKPTVTIREYKQDEVMDS